MDVSYWIGDEFTFNSCIRTTAGVNCDFPVACSVDLSEPDVGLLIVIIQGSPEWPRQANLLHHWTLLQRLRLGVQMHSLCSSRFQ